MPRKLTLLGMDPSFRNWGLALGELDLDTGAVRILELETIQTEKSKDKQVRTNSSDILACRIWQRQFFLGRQRRKSSLSKYP